MDADGIAHGTLDSPDPCVSIRLDERIGAEGEHPGRTIGVHSPLPESLVV